MLCLIVYFNINDISYFHSYTFAVMDTYECNGYILSCLEIILFPKTNSEWLWGRTGTWDKYCD